MMLTSNSDTERHTIPRWNSIETAERLGELAPLKKNNQHSMNAAVVLDDLLAEWRVEKSLPLASEIISNSRITGSEEDISQVIDYAREKISEIKEVPALLKELILDEATESLPQVKDIAEQIKMTKQALIRYPNNPLLWNELARDYIIDGQRKKSEKAVRVAFSLAPNNRVILRSIARFYDHVGEPDHALYYLRRSERLRQDPWLLSSEIALSNTLGKTSRNIKAAQGIIISNNYDPYACSELASELGTMDYFTGNSKQGKRKLELAVSDPFENAVAQIAWLDKNVKRIENIIERIPQTVGCNYEAEARLQFASENWEEAQKFSALWQSYQPFSKVPAVFNSFISADYLMDYDAARRASTQGLLSNPDDTSLWNNLIYALILSGNIDEAKVKYETKVSQHSKENDIALIATGGLLKYRMGDYLQGRILYQKALEKAKGEARQEFYFRGLLCFAREEKRAGYPITDLVNQITDQKNSALQMRYKKIIENYQILE